MRRSSGDIDRLIADLQTSDSIRRDAAVARLRILGGRAFPRLLELVTTHESATVRALALEALEGLDDVRAIEVAFDALRDGDVNVVIAALGVLRGWVAEETGTRLLDVPWVRHHLVKPDKRARIEENFHRYGVKILLGARLLPGPARSPKSTP